MKVGRRRTGVIPKGDERGIALIVALWAVALLFLLGIAFLSASVLESSISSNEVDRARTFNIAEAGLEHARRELRDIGINSTLATCTGNPCIAQINFTSGGQKVSFAGGTYSVTVRDDADDADPTVDSNNKVIITSTGAGVNARQVIEATVGRPLFPPGAVITGDNLQISGNPTVDGNAGTVHSNGDLDIPGNPTVSQDLTASGDYEASGSPTVGGIEGGGKPTVDIPAVVPAYHRPLADYVLKADGKVYESDGTVVFDTSGGSAWPSNDGGWKLSGDKWDWGGDQVGPLANSVFYIEGNAIIGSNPGTVSNPWEVLVIAEGYIEISGNPEMQANTDDLVLVAGTDVKIGGVPIVSGIIAAHEQIGISGDLNLTGYVIAEDAATNDPTVVSNYISGNPQITYNGNLAGPGSTSFVMLDWRQVF